MVLNKQSYRQTSGEKMSRAKAKDRKMNMAFVYHQKRNAVASAISVCFQFIASENECQQNECEKNQSFVLFFNQKNESLIEVNETDASSSCK